MSVVRIRRRTLNFTRFSLTADRFTVSATFALSDCRTSAAMLMVGGASSSSMVPCAVASVAISAFDDGLDSVTVKVSSGSSVMSSSVDTVTVAVVSLAVMVSVPVAADRSVKSPVSAVSSVASDAVQVAVTSAAAASDRLTVKATPWPSSASASPMLSAGRPSSSSILPSAVTVVAPPAKSALVALDSVSVKVSSSSSVRSSVVDTVSVFAVSPGAPGEKVSVPESAVKSVPATAVSSVSFDAAQSTVTCRPLSGSSFTVNSTASPSLADASVHAQRRLGVVVGERQRRLGHAARFTRPVSDVARKAMLNVTVSSPSSKRVVGRGHLEIRASCLSRGRRAKLRPSPKPAVVRRRRPVAVR